MVQAKEENRLTRMINRKKNASRARKRILQSREMIGSCRVIVGKSEHKVAGERRSDRNLEMKKMKCGGNGVKGFISPPGSDLHRPIQVVDIEVVIGSSVSNGGCPIGSDATAIL